MSDSVGTLPSESPGRWLTRQMERRGINARRFADEMRVTTQTIYAWQNDRTVISEERVPRLAEVLGVSELEARRGLGYWVPAGDEPQGPQLRDELIELRGQLQAILDRIDEIREQ